MTHPDPLPALARLVAIMARLRHPETGCAWDREQTFATIAPYTIEEAYEVADAVARGDTAALKDELGDLLLQVVFHARIAEEAGAFALADVADAIIAKMERRHPHLFGDATPRTAAEVSETWEAMKAGERGQGSAMAGVALALPALMRAEKLGKRAARVGFDWPDAAGARAKVLEELAEVDAATTAAEREEELGDLLFAVVNLARHLKIDPEGALRAANAKFERRFRAMEAIGEDPFAGLDQTSKDVLWAKVKSSG